MTGATKDGTDISRHPLVQPASGVTISTNKTKLSTKAWQMNQMMHKVTILKGNAFCVTEPTLTVSCEASSFRTLISCM